MRAKPSRRSPMRRAGTEASTSSASRCSSSAPASTCCTCPTGAELPPGSPRFPDMPTIGEFYPDYEVTIWLGLFAPAGTPEPIVTALRTEVQKALGQSDLAEKLNVTGALQPLMESPEEF